MKTWSSARAPDRRDCFGRLRPNWFLGIRTPWTLSSAEAWRRTHRVAGRLMVGAGLCAVGAAVALPGRQAVAAGLALFVGSLGGSAVPSLAFWRSVRAV